MCRSCRDAPRCLTRFGLGPRAWHVLLCVLDLDGRRLQHDVYKHNRRWRSTRWAAACARSNSRGVGTQHNRRVQGVPRVGLRRVRVVQAKRRESPARQAPPVLHPPPACGNRGRFGVGDDGDVSAPFSTFDVCARVGVTARRGGGVCRGVCTSDQRQRDGSGAGCTHARSWCAHAARPSLRNVPRRRRHVSTASMHRSCGVFATSTHHARGGANQTRWC